MAYYLILCLIGIVLFTWIIGRRRVLRLDSIVGFYLFFFFVAFFLRPFYIFQAEYFRIFYQLGVEVPEGWWAWDELMVRGGIAVILGLMCFAVAYRNVVFRGFAFKNEIMLWNDWLSNSRLRRKLVILSLVLAAVATTSIFVYNAFPGLRDIPEVSWFDLQDRSGRGFSESTGYLVHMEIFSMPAAVIFFLATSNMLLTLPLIAPYILLKIWLGWGRQGLIHMMVSLLVAPAVMRLSRRAKRKGILIGVILLVGSAAVLGVLGQQRTAFQAYFYERGGVLTNYWESTFEGYLNSLVGFEISLHWLKYTPENYPFEWGGNYLYQLFILPIPRMLWPNKHNIFARYVPARYIEDVSYLWGSAPGCIGDAWKNGGWAGIIILFLLAGSLAGLAQRTRNWQGSPFTGRVIFVLAYPFAITAVRDGLAPLSSFLYFFGVPIYFVYLLEKRFRKSKNGIHGINILKHNRVALETTR